MAGVSAAVTVNDMDVMAELSGMNLQRVTVVLAQQPAAGDRLDSNTFPFELLPYVIKFTHKRNFI